MPSTVSVLTHFVCMFTRVHLFLSTVAAVLQSCKQCGAVMKDGPAVFTAHHRQQRPTSTHSYDTGWCS